MSKDFKRRFRSFLKAQNAEEDFYRELKRLSYVVDFRKEDMSPERYVIGAFAWEITNKGEEYYKELHKKWVLNF